MDNQPSETFAGRVRDEVGAGTSCSLLWFDHAAGVRLTPRSVLSLFQFIGTQRFFGVPTRVAPKMALLVGVSLLSLYFTVVDSTYLVRLMISVRTMATIIPSPAYLIFHHDTSSFAPRLPPGHRCPWPASCRTSPA